MRNGTPHCVTCFDHLHAQFCDSCGLVIGVDDGQVAHGGQHWHATQSCFSCHTCHSSLLNKPFLPRRGFVFCSVGCSKTKATLDDEVVDEDTTIKISDKESCSGRYRSSSVSSSSVSMPTSTEPGTPRFKKNPKVYYSSVRNTRRKERSLGPTESDIELREGLRNPPPPKSPELKSTKEPPVVVNKKTTQSGSESCAEEFVAFQPINSIHDLLSLYSQDETGEEDDNKADEVLKENVDDDSKLSNPTSGHANLATEMARKMLQHNLEQLLLAQKQQSTERRDVISQVTGAMTSEQVQKLIKLTEQELDKVPPQKTPHKTTTKAAKEAPIKPKESIIKETCHESSQFLGNTVSSPCTECGVVKVKYHYWTPQTHRRRGPRTPAPLPRRNADFLQKRSKVAKSVILPGAPPPPLPKCRYYSPQVSRRRKSEDLSWLATAQQPCCETSESSGDEVDLTTCEQNHPPSFYGGVRPTYLPNSRSRARKILLTQQELPQQQQHQCHGCCHHQKTSKADKLCIIA